MSENYQISVLCLGHKPLEAKSIREKILARYLYSPRKIGAIILAGFSASGISVNES
ncbi:protein of unknown function [Stenotrophomonas maltophilia]|nr:protein of unknown function [Stenotrophomonas maltophilia]